MHSKTNDDSSVIHSLVNFTFIGCVFLALGSIHLPYIDIYYYYIFVIILFPLLLFRYSTIDRSIFFVSIYLLIVGLVNVLLGNNTAFSFFKVYIGCFIFYYLFYLIIKYKNFNINLLFRLYYKFAIFHAYIGVFQFFSYLIGFSLGYDYSWFGLRVMVPSYIGGIALYPINALTGEPAAFVFVQSAALYMAIIKLFKPSSLINGTKFDALLIIFSFLLSQSSTGYFAFFISIMLIFTRSISVKTVILALISLPVTLISLINLVPKFQSRLSTIVSLITGSMVVYAAERENAAGSSLILFNHFLIAKKNASNHFFGTGLGSHHLAFQRYNELQTWFTGYGLDSMILNENDASSLFNRILSEMGYFGIIALFYFLYKFYLRTGSNTLIIINHASLVVIFTALLRSGHYFILGLPFFVLSYYYSSKQSHINSSI